MIAICSLARNAIAILVLNPTLLCLDLANHFSQWRFSFFTAVIQTSLASWILLHAAILAHLCTLVSVKEFMEVWKWTDSVVYFCTLFPCAADCARVVRVSSDCDGCVTNVTIIWLLIGCPLSSLPWMLVHFSGCQRVQGGCRADNEKVLVRCWALRSEGGVWVALQWEISLWSSWWISAPVRLGHQVHEHFKFKNNRGWSIKAVRVQWMDQLLLRTHYSSCNFAFLFCFCLNQGCPILGPSCD